jgi:hypothetical protein
MDELESLEASLSHYHNDLPLLLGAVNTRLAVIKTAQKRAGTRIRALAQIGILFAIATSLVTSGLFCVLVVHSSMEE